MTDEEYMAAALNLAEAGLGRVAPNPSVGCIIVQNDIIVGQARTADGGRPHAEILALEMAGDKAKGSTVYVTLEPCCHHGRTLPCTDSLIAAQVSKVIVACLDEDKRVAGQGVKALRNAGITVVTGVLEQNAHELNEGFFRRIKNYRPLVTLKIATSVDSKIATLTGQSQWITGEEARSRVHVERSRHDAILTGIGTILEDDPLLTTR
jgi:diaminohydroxyphosphoribosylaminopyrimidine deaminase/5-amino-6-(5-phosphoribosylamino)uracil reductase